MSDENNVIRTTVQQSELNDNETDISFSELSNEERFKVLEIEQQGLEFKMQELNLKKQELELKAKNEASGFDNAKHAVTESHEFKKTQLIHTTSRTKIFVFGLGLPALLLFSIFIYYALHLGHNTLVNDIVKFTVGAGTGLLGGFGVGKYSNSSS